MDSFDYYNPVKMLFGNNRLDDIGKVVASYGKRILFVYGREHLKKAGTHERIIASLRKAGLGWIEFSDVQPNPRVEHVRKAIQLCREEGIDFVLGAGGGSTSDSVKAIAFGAMVDFDVWDAFEDFHNLMHGNAVSAPRIPVNTLPFGVIMTKPGTGSGFDYTTVLTNEATREKLMVINKSLYAKFVIEDPALAQTLPANERAFGIADIMTHYLEQYFSVSSQTQALDRLTEAGLRTVIESGRRVMSDPSSIGEQANLLYCADWACSDQSMAGIRGEWAAHMIEHEITALTDLNHGHGMAMVFSKWMRFVLDAIPQKFARFAEKVWGIARNGRSDFEYGLAGIEKTEEFWRELGIILSLSKCGVSTDIIPEIARKTVRFGTIGNLKNLDEKDVRLILEDAA